MRSSKPPAPGSGPMLLECLTHRRRGHYEGDAESYRDELAEAEWNARDPLARLERHAVEQRWLSEQDAARIAEEATADVDRAVQFARASPYPDPSLSAELVYA